MNESEVSIAGIVIAGLLAGLRTAIEHAGTPDEDKVKLRELEALVTKHLADKDPIAAGREQL